MRSKRILLLIPYLSVTIASVIWGATFVVGKITLHEFPVMSLSFLRFFLACLFLLPFFWTQPQKFSIKLKHIPKLLGAGLGLITFNIAFFYVGLQYTTAIDASALTLIIPSLSVLLGWWLFREKIYLINLTGIFIGLIGSIVIVGLPQLLFSSAVPGTLIGNGLIVLSDITFVIGAVFSRQMLKIYSNLTVTGTAFFIGVLTFLIPAINEYLQNPKWIYNVTILGFLGLLFMVLLSSICAYFLYQWGLEQIGLLQANMFQYLEPVVATALAVPFLGERISFSFLIGTVLIIVGVFWGTLGKTEPHHYRHKAQRI